MKRQHNSASELELKTDLYFDFETVTILILTKDTLPRYWSKDGNDKMYLYVNYICGEDSVKMLFSNVLMCNVDGKKKKHVNITCRGGIFEYTATKPDLFRCVFDDIESGNTTGMKMSLQSREIKFSDNMYNPLSESDTESYDDDDDSYYSDSDFD